jgi:hypothetical protein
MTPLGWVFMVVSVGFVWGLCGWCFFKVLSYEEPPNND